MRGAILARLARFVVVFAVVSMAQRSARPEDGQIFIFSTVEILDSDGELPKLLKQRFNAAGEELEAQSALYVNGRVSLEAVLASVERFTKYGLELKETPALQLQHLEQALLAAKKIEEIVRVKHDHGN